METRNWDEAITLTTGGNEELQIVQLRDEFFEEVHKSLGFITLSAIDNPFVELTSRSLGREEPAGFLYSDDSVHEMVVCNELLALVIDRRNDGNYHEVTFWSRRPSALCSKQIGRIIAQFKH